MATETTLLKLKKPAASDAADINVLNQNFQSIDDFLTNYVWNTGLGRNGKSVDTLDDAKTFGLYMSNVGVPPIEGKVYWVCLVMPHNTDQTMMQIAYRSTSNPTQFATRRMTNGVWDEWEYINPPMYAGVEYRTAERWGNKPVYRKRIVFTSSNIGVDGKTDDLNIPHGITGIGDIVRVDGKLIVSTGVYQLPYLSSTGGLTLVNSVGNANVVVRHQGTWNGDRTWTINLAYTKA